MYVYVGVAGGGYGDQMQEQQSHALFRNNFVLFVHHLDRLFVQNLLRAHLADLHAVNAHVVRPDNVLIRTTQPPSIEAHPAPLIRPISRPSLLAIPSNLPATTPPLLPNTALHSACPPPTPLPPVPPHLDPPLFRPSINSVLDRSMQPQPP